MLDPKDVIELAAGKHFRAIIRQDTRSTEDHLSVFRRDHRAQIDAGRVKPQAASR